MNGLFSIRTKFLAIMSALLMGCVAVYLLIAVKVFRNDKTELVFDLNRSMVTNLAAELDTQLTGVSDKFKLFALFANDTSAKLLNQNLFSEDSEVVFAALYRADHPLTGKKFTSKKYLETYGLASDFFVSELLEKRPIPFQDILRNGEFLWNATIENGTPLIGYGRSVLVEDEKGAAVDHLAVVGYLKPDKILKALSVGSVSEVSVVDPEGRVLIHHDPAWMKQGRSLADHPLFRAARDAKVAVSVASLSDDLGQFLGAFAKAYNDRIFVLARSPEEKVFSAVEDLVSESLIFALIVITGSLLFAVLFSRALTEPISLLVEGMRKVATGDLSTQIEVKTRDETRMLASSFNKMIRDLKQSRDELQEINRELDQKVKDRTRQLEIQSQAVKEAQEALLRTTRLASAGEIAGRTAHEVLNPLTGIMTRVSGIDRRVRMEIAPQLNMMNDIVASWKKDHQEGGFEKLVTSWKSPSTVQPEASLWDEDLGNLEAVRTSFETLLGHLEKDVQFLLHEGNRINKIIDAMRKLSHLSSDVKTYSARKLLIDCRNIMADLFNQAEIPIVEDFATGEDEIDIDRDEFIQAVTNLMRNALQAMRSAGEKKDYCLHMNSKILEDRVVIEITDNGPGIAPEYQSKLFESQFTTKPAEEGTGLGLGISRRFIRAHGGDIEFVVSNAFAETTFRIQLPLKAYRQTTAESLDKAGAA